MTEAKHTPAPWEEGDGINGSKGFIYCDNEFGSAIAITRGKNLFLTAISSEEAEANTNLITAAPNMYTRLEADLKLFNQILLNSSEKNAFYKELEQTIWGINEILKKTKGETL